MLHIYIRYKGSVAINFDLNYLLLHPDPDEKAQYKNQYLKQGQNIIHHLEKFTVVCVLLETKSLQFKS